MKNYLIESTKEHIYQISSKIILVTINVNRVANNQYESRILLKTKSRSLYAAKKASGYSQSLSRTYRAIKKQIEKLKINKIHSLPKNFVFEDSRQADLAA